MTQGQWLAKVRHYRGGESVLTYRESRTEAQADADAWNERYQTDAAFVEAWDPAKTWPTESRRRFENGLMR
jgi:hypothetical protein